MSIETKIGIWKYRINLLNARDPETNRFIVKKLQRKIRNAEKNVSA